MKIGIDLGTANVLVYVKGRGIVIQETEQVPAPAVFVQILDGFGDVARCSARADDDQVLDHGRVAAPRVTAGSR